MRKTNNQTNLLGRLFLLVLLLSVSLSTKADDYLEKESNYTAMLWGNDKLQIKLPTQNDITGAFNRGVTDGRVYVTIDGGERQLLLWWDCNTHYSDLSAAKVFHANQPGRFNLMGTAYGVKSDITKDDGTVMYFLKPDAEDGDHYTTTVEWTVPRIYRGHRLKIEVWCQIDDATSSWFIPKGQKNPSSFYVMGTVDMPEAGEASVTLTDPMLATGRDHANEIMLSYSFVVNKIYSATLHYTDAVTNKQYTQTLSTSKKVDFAYLPANRPWKDIHIKASVLDVQTKTDNPNDKVDIESEKFSSSMLHHPRGLSAKLEENGFVTLNWQVDDPDQGDIYEGDFFEIQRNLMGATDDDDPYWKTISMEVSYKNNQKDYSFVDETLIDQYEGKEVTYRVRRSVSSMWQWINSSTYAQYLMSEIIYLPRIAGATVSRTKQWNDESHIAKFDLLLSTSDGLVVYNDEDLEAARQKILDGEIAQDKIVIPIRNAADWDRCAKAVEMNIRKPNIVLMYDVKLTRDSKMIGSESSPFAGTFYGNGHTLEIDFFNKADYTAPFRYVEDATIKDLHITGRIESEYKFMGGLIACVYNRSGNPTKIYNCRSSVSIETDYSDDTSSGGFIGRQMYGELNIFYCLFDGRFSFTRGSSNKNHSNGGFIGWKDDTSDRAYIRNCLFAPIEISTGYDNCATFSRAKDLSSVTLVNCYYTQTYGSETNGANDCNGVSAKVLAGYLNDYGVYWEIKDDKVVPVVSEHYQLPVAVWDQRAKLKLRINMHGEKGVESTIVDISDNDEAINHRFFTYELSRKCVDYSFDLLQIRGSSPLSIVGYDKDTLVVHVYKFEGNNTDYSFNNMNRVENLKWEKKQSSVVLTWDTSGGESDFYRVLRRKHTTQEDAEWTDTIATNLTLQQYEDISTQIQVNYDYCVQSVLQCEGTHITQDICSNAACETTGKIEGYIRLADGTSMGGQTVICEPVDIPGTSSEYKVISDDSGYFVFDKLPIYFGPDGKVQGEYHVSVMTSGSGGKYTGPNEQGIVSFNRNVNWKQEFNFYMDTYFIYSGNVFYDTSSIPVPGVSFLLDGKLMNDASNQLITTDTQGAFALSIPRGEHSVQAVKDGHTFANNGYLLNPDAREGEDKTRYNFVNNVSSIYIWDSTTVVLRGRVVGGDIEGSRPLGHSLSTNNLGDSLKIVMQLEGDNASYIFRDPKNESLRSTSYKVDFGSAHADTTQVTKTRRSITIRPDAKTGEYELRVHPAKYKITEVSAQGYATLFQNGQVGQTLDLTFNVGGDTCEYNRIYHAIPDVEVTQYNPTGEKYFGVKWLTAQDNIGNKSNVNLVYYTKVTPEAKDSIVHYSFGYPVFMAGSPYGFMLQACEKYYWNNDPSKKVDIVKLDQRGKIIIKNALTTDSKTAQWESDLDEDGGCDYIFTPDNATFTMEGDNALKTFDITLLYDGTYYDVKPFYGNILRGYVMATKAKPEGRKAIVAGKPQLWDILRDPPGGSSTSYIKEGSKLSYGYSIDVTAAAGFTVKTTTGTGVDSYKGYVLAPNGYGGTTGTLDKSKSKTGIDLKFEFNFGHSWNWSYGMDITERIQTKSGQKWVAGKADLFIGTTESFIVQDAIAVRVVPDSMYQIVKLHEGGTYEAVDNNGQVVTKVKVPVGTTKVLAQGTDDTGKPIYLVRDEVMSMSPTVTSTFVHSQHYIENELLPDLFKIRNSLILPKGTDVTKAKALADSRGYATYISNVDADDKAFGVDYTVVRPNNETTGDSIKALNQEILAWVGFLAKNEEEKLSVVPTDLVKRYDFDGAANIQYSENFTMGKTMSRYLRYPGVTGLGNLFAATGPLAIIMSTLEEKLKKEGGSIKADPVPYIDYSDVFKHGIDLEVSGSTWETQWGIILNINASDKYNSSESHSKEVGFTLAASSKSSLTVDVYRTGTEYTIDENTNYFNKITLETLSKVRYGTLTPPMMTFASFTNEKVYSNFVFRTIGGVTCQPYEGERVTKWHQPGMVLDVATIPADKPRIWIEQPVVSNVPFDEPARFVLHMANETDYPERATLKFNYFLEAGSNPNGARVCVDGAPLTGAGVDLVLWPAIGSDGKHNVFTKEITVYPSKAFDYEDMAICLMDPEDNSRVFTQKFSAHFIPTSGKVKVSVPSNNWVINTESPFDGKRKAYYMPVRIEGFDVNWPNFDHIELQYKLSTQGDNDWVNVCSYYQDRELQKKASGVTDTIPSSGVIVAPFYGEVDPIEQYYDIRAVTFCRHAGGYLTGASEVLKGIKDTRRPETFGTPEPTNGILGIGDDILIKFSEPIAGNYLRGINNFEVLGTLMSNDISTSTSLSFDGNAVAGTQGERNLMGKSFTVDIMLNPAIDQREMTVFSHGGDEKGLRFGITADRRLSATINGETLVSDSIVAFNNMLHQVAYVLDQSGETTTVKFYDGNTPIGKKELAERYEGATSGIILGADFDYSEDLRYKGEMLEFRLWNRALTGSELLSYGQKKLSGYETGLLDYYPMNEGEGSWAYDKAPGSMDLWLAGTSWKRPAGISMEIKGDKGLCIKPDKFVRSKNHDFTLTFWFHTNDENATLFSNGEANYGQADQLNIGIKDSILYVRSQGFERKISAFVSEGSWHHFAMTVSRSQNVSNVYVDKKLVESFPADSVGGIMGNDITLGATFVDKGKHTNVMKGHIDELGLFSSVLPVNLIKEYSNHTPLGTMSALLAYLDFGRSEKLDNNQQHLEPTGISLKRYVDSLGKLEERRDTLLSDEEVKALAARDFYAPMVSNSQMDNLRYSYVANDNELYVNVNEPDFLIEKTNIYVTLKEIPDLQGNLMASPVTLNLYVYRNPLRWDVKRIEKDVRYGEGVTFEATVKNLSGVTQDFKLEDLPLWINASQTQGVLDALDEQTITFTVSDYINIGTYNEQIALIGDNMMSEPLPITLRVRGDEPDWTVPDRLKKNNQTMMMVARVKIDGVVASSKEDILAVFDDKQQVLGVAHIEVNDNANANEALAYLTIYGYNFPNGTGPTLNFRFFDASSGNVYSVTPADSTTYNFQQDAIVGTDANPVVLLNNYNYMQALKLKTGWNWVSFYVIPKEGTTLGQFLNSMSKWEVGEVITVVNGTETRDYYCRENAKAANGKMWDNEDDPITIHPEQMYSIYSKSDKTIYLEGEFARRYITVHKDWNRVGYNSMINLPISQALADYLEKAQEGDVVKSQDGFAIASQSATGLVWKGNLQYMEAGKGYMFKRQADSEVQFLYPLYFDDSRYSSTSESRAPRRTSVNTATTMNIVAAVDGVETEKGDRLVVFCGAERIAEATADDEKNYYLNIGSDFNSSDAMTFMIERDGEPIAMTGSSISYAPNKVLGTPDNPTVISFVSIDQMPNDGKWYTVGGIVIGEKPKQRGVYIHNGKAVVVR